MYTKTKNIGGQILTNQELSLSLIFLMTFSLLSQYLRTKEIKCEKKNLEPQCNNLKEDG
jgi:hypothetical protein